MSRTCHTCGWHQGGHDPACPVIHPDLQSNYDAGWLVGRRGNERPEGRSPAFYLGYGKGESAREESDNGHKSWGY